MLQDVMEPSTMLTKSGRVMCLPMKKNTFVTHEVLAAENASVFEVRCQRSVLPKGHKVDSSDELQVFLDSQRMLSVIVFLKGSGADIFHMMLPI